MTLWQQRPKRQRMQVAASESPAQGLVNHCCASKQSEKDQPACLIVCEHPIREMRLLTLNQGLVERDVHPYCIPPVDNTRVPNVQEKRQASQCRHAEADENNDRPFHALRSKYPFFPKYSIASSTLLKTRVAVSVMNGLGMARQAQTT